MIVRMDNWLVLAALYLTLINEPLSSGKWNSFYAFAKTRAPPPNAQESNEHGFDLHALAMELVHNDGIAQNLTNRLVSMWQKLYYCE